MDALRRINIIDDIPAWHPALRSPVKLRQSAKRHLADPSLAAANDSSVSHYHDADDLEVDAIIHRRDGTWIAVEVKLGSPQIPEASANLLRLERKLVKRGEMPPAAKLIVIGPGMPVHTTPEGIIVVPVDTLAP